MKIVFTIAILCLSATVAAEAPKYKLIHLGESLPVYGDSYVYDVNDNLQAVGKYEDVNDDIVTFLYDAGAVAVVGTSDVSTWGLAIDAAGVVYGSMRTDETNSNGEFLMRLFIFKDGVRSELLDIQAGSPESEYHYWIDAVSDNGRILGHTYNANLNPVSRNFVYANGQLQFIDFGTVRAWADINNSGAILIDQKIGDCKTAVIQESGGSMALSDVADVCNNEPVAINNRGDVLTNTYLGDFPRDEYSPALHRDGVLTPLPSLGYDNEPANALNDYGQVLGIYGNGRLASRVYLYSDGQMYDFAELVTDAGAFDTRASRTYAFNITNGGVIGGSGPLAGAFRQGAFIARPFRIQAEVDIDPDSPANELDPYSADESFELVVYTTSKQAGERLDFDATAVVAGSVQLGADGASPVTGVPQIIDIDGDQDDDLVFTFNTAATGLQCFDTELLFRGELNDGEIFYANAAVRTVAACGGTWETTLQPRDVNADGRADAYYDTVLDITWLADARFEAYPDGLFGATANLAGAQARVDMLNSIGYLGVDDWRLPHAEAGVDLPDCIYDYGATRCGEMSHLFFETLGNRAFLDANGNPFQLGSALFNPGPFENFGPAGYPTTGEDYRSCPSDYWYGTREKPWQAYVFSFCRGSTFLAFEEATNVVWPVRDGDIGGATVGAGAPESVFCPGDVNGDSVADIAVLTAAAEVIVRDLNDNPVNQFMFSSLTPASGATLVPDYNYNGAAELAALFGDSGLLEVRDLKTGVNLTTMNSQPGLEYTDLELLSGNIVNNDPQLAVLGLNPAAVYQSNGFTFSRRADISMFVDPVDLEIYPDQGGDGYVDYGVLSANDGAAKSDLLELYGPERTQRALAPYSTKYLSKGLQVLAQELVSDTNGNGYPDTAVLRRDYSSDVKHVAMLDMSTGQALGYVGLDPAFEPMELLTIGDVNGNGSDELVVFATEAGGTRQKAQVKDSKTRKFIKAVYFDPNFAALDVATCGDLNGNGTAEIVVLGKRADNGKVRAIVKDSKTGDLVGKVDF